MQTNNILFLLCIPKKDQDNSPCSCSRLSLPGRGHVLFRCSHTVHCGPNRSFLLHGEAVISKHLKIDKEAQTENNFLLYEDNFVYLMHSLGSSGPVLAERLQGGSQGSIVSNRTKNHITGLFKIFKNV